MAYLAGFIIVGVLFLVLHYFTQMGNKEKSIVSLVVLSVILFAIAYNSYNSDQREKMLSAIMKFNQNKTLKCNGAEVDNKNFTLSIGTHTFIGKENTPYYGQMISAASCE